MNARTLLHDRQFLGGQDVGELVEVAVRRRQRLSLLVFFDGDGHLVLLSINLHQLAALISALMSVAKLKGADVAKHPRDFE